MTEQNFDVAIIGGGPAGCAAALTLRSRDCSAVVISAPNPREKPTETAGPNLLRLITTLNAEEALKACKPCYGIVSAWGRKTDHHQSSIESPYGHPYFIDRTSFDCYLQRAARGKGASWMMDKFQGARFDSDGVTVVMTHNQVRVRWLVLATGSPATSALVTGQRPSTQDSLTAFWSPLLTPFESRLLFVEPTDYGWWYLCPAVQSGAIACLVTDRMSARRLRPAQPEAWNNLFRETNLFKQVKSHPSVKLVRVAQTGLIVLPRKAGPRWIAAGDAAAKLDPLGSSGTVTALESGHRAALAVAHALEADEGSLDQYEQWASGLVEEFARQRRQQYALERIQRPDGFWSRRMDLAFSSASRGVS